MNLNAPQPSFNLPALPDQDVSGSGSRGNEKVPARPEKYVQPAQPAPVADPQAVAQQAAQHAQQAINPSISHPPTAQPAPSLADDNDLIEKEWVLKAKQ